LYSRAREKEKDRERWKHKSARVSDEFAKERERERKNERASWKERKRDEFASSLDSSPLPRLLRGKGVKEGHDVPNERAP